MRIPNNKQVIRQSDVVYKLQDTVKSIVDATAIHLITFIRIKQAIFWSLVFPIFLYVIFGNIWGKSSTDYLPFLLTGILGMTTTSEGLLAVGAIIKQYYLNGTVKYLKKLPINIVFYFSGIIFCRFILLGMLIATLIVISFFVFSLVLSFSDFFGIFLGILLGIWIFSFFGLCISFTNIKSLYSGQGIAKLLYFMMLFASDAFYRVSEFNSTIGKIGDMLPLNAVLAVLRGESVSAYILLLWVFIPVVVFYLLFKRVKFSR